MSGCEMECDVYIEVSPAVTSPGPYNNRHQHPRWAPATGRGDACLPITSIFPQLLFLTLHIWRRHFSVTYYTILLYTPAAFLIIDRLAYLHK